MGFFPALVEFVIGFFFDLVSGAVFDSLLSALGLEDAG